MVHAHVSEEILEELSFFGRISGSVPFRLSRTLGNNRLSMAVPVEKVVARRSTPSSSRTIIIVESTIVRSPSSIGPEAEASRGILTENETHVAGVDNVAQKQSGSFPVSKAGVVRNTSQSVDLICDVRSRRPSNPEELSNASPVRFGSHGTFLFNVIRAGTVPI